MKIGIVTSRERVEKYTDFSQLPQDFELIHLGICADEQVIATQAADCRALLVDPILQVSAELIAALPNLQLIHSEGVAYHRFNLAAAAAAQVYVCNNTAANATAVAEQAIMLMLAGLRRLNEGQQLVFAGRQAEAKGRFILEGIRELRDCHVGIIGLGAIGSATAKLLHAFGCRVSYTDYERQDEATERACSAAYLPLPQLLADCDIISLHAPVNPQTTNMVNAEFLAAMKKDAFLINTARGELVDQTALAQALEQGIIGGAGLDTLAPEPVTLDNPLLQMTAEAQLKLTLSPHIGGTTDSVFRKIYANIWQNMRAIAQGNRPNCIVNGL